MSEAKFTKGEWVVEGSSMSMGANYRGSFSIKSRDFVGDISAANIANKALIAAAPEMYDLINDLRHSICVGRLGGDINNTEVLKSIDELLAKARGEHE